MIQIASATSTSSPPPPFASHSIVPTTKMLLTNISEDEELQGQEAFLSIFSKVLGGLAENKAANEDVKELVLEEYRVCMEDMHATSSSQKRESLPHGFLIKFMTSLVIVSRDHPDVNTRKAMSDFLNSLALLTKTPLPRPFADSPSKFMAQCPQVGDSSHQRSEEEREIVTKVFSESYFSEGCVPNLLKLLAFHPTYLEEFTRRESFLFWEQGPLAPPLRHMIAILAASKHKCSYLVKFHTKRFLEVEGPKDWLKGSRHLPLKLQALLPLTAYLAFAPWLVNAKHVALILRNTQLGWSMGELVHAATILAHTISLSSTVLGCGLNLDLDMKGAWMHERRSEDGATANFLPSKPSHPSSKYPPTTPRELREKLLNAIDDEDFSHEANILEFESAEPQESDDDFARMSKCRRQSDSASTNSSDNLSTSSSSPVFTCLSSAFLIPVLEDGGDDSIEAFEEPEEIPQAHLDFPTASKTIPLLHYHEFTWENHGFPILSRFFPLSGEILDDGFKHIRELTYGTIGLEDESLDTSKYRDAVWNYILRLYGIVNDDYNYSMMNSILDRDTKAFLKLVSCQPDLLAPYVFDSFSSLTVSEKVHIILIASEARKQSSLLFFLRAINSYSWDK